MATVPFTPPTDLVWTCSVLLSFHWSAGSQSGVWMGEARRAFWETNHVVPFPHRKVVIARKILFAPWEIQQFHFSVFKKYSKKVFRQTKLCKSCEWNWTEDRIMVNPCVCVQCGWNKYNFWSWRVDFSEDSCNRWVQALLYFEMMLLFRFYSNVWQVTVRDGPGRVHLAVGL
jgi:hypothetical protein